MADPTPMEVPSRKSTDLRGRNILFPSSIATKKVKSKRPFNRSEAKKNFHEKHDVEKNSSQRKGKTKYFEHPIEIVDITTPQDERNPTFKRLRENLKNQWMRLIN
jgi:hypothetical protein